MRKFTFQFFIVSLLFTFYSNNSFAQKNPATSVVTGRLIRVTPALADIDRTSMYGKPLVITRDKDGIIGREYVEEAEEKLEEESKRRIKREYLAAIKNMPKGVQNTEVHSPNVPGTTLGANFNGLTSPGLQPTDNNMAAGPNHVIQTVNNVSGTQFSIWNKAGTVLQAGTILSTLTGVPGDGDPVVLYDQLADRWFLAEFGGSTGTNSLIIAVSTTPNPMGTWSIYQFTDAAFFPDYPKFSVWHNAYYAYTNDFTPPGVNPYLGTSLWAFDRTAMIAGAPTAAMLRQRVNITNGFNMGTVGLEGMTPSTQNGLFMVPTSATSLSIFEVTPNFTTSTITVGPSTALPVNAWSAAGSIAQQTGSNLGSLSPRFMFKINYRNNGGTESIVATHTIANGTLGQVRWYELRRVGGVWTVFQQGNVAGTDGNSRWMPGISMDACGNIALMYDVAGTGTPAAHPSIRYTGRNASDPLNTMTLPESVILNSTVSAGSLTRWGDYNTLVQDYSAAGTPVNGSFWATSQHSNQLTRLANFTLTGGCAPGGPSVTINQAAGQGDPTGASPINFTVVFSAAVTGFATGDVTLTGTAGATTGTVTGSGTTYNVAVSGMTGTGTVIATIAADVAIDGSSVGNLASTSTDNTVTFNLPDIIPPTVTINQAVAQVDPTATSPINFTVVFNETVTGFATGDVTLSGTAGATTATVTGSGTTYNVAVSGMTATGTVIATIAAGVAIDAAGNPNLASTSTDNTVTFNATPPSVTINQAAAQADPTGISPINFTVVFNEPVTGFATGDVVLSGTAGATTGTVTGSGTTYNVAVSGMTLSGTVIATVPAAVAIDIDNNDNLASTSTDNTVTFNSCVVVCPANITVGNTSGQCGAIVTYPAPTAGPGCGTVTSTPASGSFFPIGTTTVNVTTTAGATCSFTIRVNDTQAPTITCPANITVSNTANQCGAIVNFAPIAADNCPIGTTTPRNLTQSAANTVTPGNSVACASLGLHTDNSYWRAYDLAPLALAGPLTINTVSFGIETANASGIGTTQPVTVRLHTSAGAFPAAVRTLVGSQTFNVPDQTNSLFTGTLTTPVTVPANAILVLEIFTPDGQAAGHSFFLGTNSGTETGPSYLSAAACAVTTPVTTASIGFPNAKWILNAAGTVPVPGSGTVSVPASGSFFPVGTTTVTSTATDGAGNTATCTFTVRVNDTQVPVINCPANITATTAVGSCVAAVTYAITATDNCPGVATVLTAGLASGSNFPIGVTTVTYRATDASGNISTCSFTVTVVDGQLPVIGTQPVNRTVCVGTNAVFSVAATSLSALSYQWQQFIGGVWTNIAGATGSSLTLNAVTLGMNDNSYRVNVIGLCNTVTSGFASLYVNPLPTISLTASNAPVLLPGQTTSIVANVNPTGGSFAWFRNGTALVPAVTVGTLSNLAVENVGTYRAVYTDLNNCVNTSEDLVVSAEASDRLFIAPNPNFGQFSIRYYNRLNELLTIRVFGSNGAVVYQKQVTTTLAYTRMDVDLGLNAPGVYVVELRNSAGVLLGQKKIIVSHR